MYVVKAFLGFWNKPGINKQRNKDTEDVIKFLFLVVFACAYAYLPSSVSYNKEYQGPLPKRKTEKKAQKEVSPKRKRNLKSKHLKCCVGKESRQQKCFYLDEPMCELVRNLRYSKIKSTKSLRKSVLPYIVKKPNRINIDDEKNVSVREMSDINKVKGTEDVNPNSNYDPSTIHSSLQPVMFSSKKQGARGVVFPNEVMNPNSVKMLRSKLNSRLIVGNKKNNDTVHFLVQPKEKSENEKKSWNCVPVRNEIFPSQQQQNEDDVINEAVRQIELQNHKLELSVLEIQKRITQIRSKNDYLEECVIEKEGQLQEKDDLILRLQMEMMNYEPVSGGPVDRKACASMIGQEQKEEINRVKKTLLNRQLQTEMRIGDLVDAVEREKERVKVLNSKAVGSEGQLWSEENETDTLLQHEPGSPLRSQVDCISSLMSAQQVQMKTSCPSSHLTMEFNSKAGNPRSEIELLKKRNRKLELQIRQSDKIIGELSREKRELELAQAQLTLQLQQEPGRENIKLNKTQAQHRVVPGQQDTEIPKMSPRPKKARLLSMSRLLSCRKVDIHRNVNRCEKERKRVITLTSSPELGQP